MSHIEPVRRGFVRIPLHSMQALTDTNAERNIYVHPNPLARRIFWQRLLHAHRLLKKHVPPDAMTLDFGGGSGAFLPSLCNLFGNVSVIDLDLGDAERIASHFQLSDVSFYRQNINAFDQKIIFDLVVATDVFEHFSDMYEPYYFLQKHLKDGGFLLLTLPTENALYELGRCIVHKTKPEDHYHSACEVVRFYEAHGYECLESCNAPRMAGVALPLFFVGLFRKVEQ